MVAVAILTVVMGMLFGLSLSMAQASRNQEARMTAVDEARRGMQALIRDLRQSATSSVGWNGLPGPVLTYQMAQDLDGNGLAVDTGANLELGPQRTVGRDTNDANNDGLTNTQLIVVDANGARVLANDLMIDEDANGNGALDAGEDSNWNGRLDRGLWFERQGRGIRVTIQAELTPGPDGAPVNSVLRDVVVPRN